MDNHKIDFAKRKAKTDEWYTPKEAIYPLIEFLTPNSTIWCPFDKDESNFVQVLKEKGFKVINTHLDYGQDFFTTQIPKGIDYIISNPPYSLRNIILEKLFSIGKPFAMLMNTNGLFDSAVRWNLFSNNNFTLMYLQGRVNYMKIQGVVEKSAPPFQSAYICHKFSTSRIAFLNKQRIKNEVRNDE